MNLKINPDANCAKCPFWKEQTDDHGWCRRFPPNHYSEHTSVDHYPVTLGTAVCGEHPQFFVDVKEEETKVSDDA